MEEKHYCLKEKEWGELNTTLKFIQEKLVTHVVEGDRAGGYRDRLKENELKVEVLNKEIATIKQGYWKACIVAGIIGGLLGKITPDFFEFVTKIIIAQL